MTKNKEAARFLVKSGQLYFQPVAEDPLPLEPPLHKLKFDSAPLGSGANGVTFRALDETLNAFYVVKLYFPGEGVEERAVLEARKNAKSAIRDVAPQVFSLDHFHSPIRVSYVVMESVSASHTLKSWIGERDKDWRQAQIATEKQGIEFTDYNNRGPSWVGDRKREVLAECLDLAAGVLQMAITMHKRGVIHGDLNPGNVLIQDQGMNSDVRSLRREPGSREQRELDGNPYLNPLSSRKVPGTITSAPIRIIDFGSSELAGTEPRIGVLRETWFLVDNLQRIMRPWFREAMTLLESWTRLHSFEDGSGVRTFRIDDDDIDPRILAGDLLRLVCVANLLLGHTHSMRDERTDAPSEELVISHLDVADLWELICGDLRQFNSSLVDGETLRALRTLEARNDSFVDWSQVFDYFKQLHPALGESLESLKNLPTRH
jgi:hypothetical protein